MPQLNPSPWFMIFLLIWATFIIMLTKVLKMYPNLVPAQEHHKSYINLWVWPWL
uniref:ATP synthase complex subunit 8 n=1 Tax=Eremias vermiculata TaxID=383861 RepID=A0A0U1XEF7_9SAUR|nr:ATP synthase F0 subunit 8 [Eremias vermiculata]AIS20780.1 ATP synthase F0 subunit 8 [Eremias vermiculata]AKQ77765.1 ATPase subunit 8 [Eremias vermiculata]QCF45865.1 ATPase subunit 8 [Eremias vermiculata]